MTTLPAPQEPFELPPNPPLLVTLLTVYHGNTPHQLEECLASLACQTRPADGTVIVIDGPIDQQLTKVVDTYAEILSAQLVQLAENLGSGPASQAGLAYIRAHYDISRTYIARLDADDIAFPERYHTQLAYLAAHPHIAALGTALAEFRDTPHTLVGIRRLPDTHTTIVRYARINSPINNPSVMLAAPAVIRVGGWRDINKMEDYDLYVRLIAAGYQLHNLAQPLTYFRLSDDVHARRAGRDALRAEWTMQQTLLQLGLVSPLRAAANLLVRTGYRLLPRRSINAVYAALFHRRSAVSLPGVGAQKV